MGDNFCPLFSKLPGRLLVEIKPLFRKVSVPVSPILGQPFWRMAENASQKEKITIRRAGLSKRKARAGIGSCFAGPALAKVWNPFERELHFRRRYFSQFSGGNLPNRLDPVWFQRLFTQGLVPSRFGPACRLHKS